MYKIDPETGMARERAVDIIGGSKPDSSSDLDSGSTEIPPLGEEDELNEEEREEAGGREAAPPPEQQPQGIPSIGIKGTKKYRCKFCGAEFTNPLELGRHINMEHQAELAARRLRRAGVSPPPGAPAGAEEESREVPPRAASSRQLMSDDEIFADIRIRGQVALEELMRERLEQLLSMPSVPKESREYVLREWDNDPSIHFDFHALSEASERPWVLLSAGVDYPDYLKQVKMAMETGCSGVLGGRAFWKEYFLQDGAEARTRFASTDGVKRVSEVDAIVQENGTPWFARYGMTKEDLSTIRASEGWHMRYAPHASAAGGTSGHVVRAGEVY